VPAKGEIGHQGVNWREERKEAQEALLLLKLEDGTSARQARRGTKMSACEGRS